MKYKANFTPNALFSDVTEILQYTLTKYLGKKRSTVTFVYFCFHPFTDFQVFFEPNENAVVKMYNACIIVF